MLHRVAFASCVSACCAVYASTASSSTDTALIDTAALSQGSASIVESTIPNYSSTGPNRVAIIDNTGPGNAYTVFRPDPFANGTHYPIITWGNGTGATPSDYRPILMHMASYGFVVVASNSTQTGSGQEMIQGLTWIIGENTRSGSDYNGKLDTVHIGAMGHSQGGGGTLNTGLDPRVTAIVPIEPSVGQAQAAIDSLSKPTLLLCGSSDNIINAQLVCTDQVYRPLSAPVVFGILRGATHWTPTGYTPDRRDGFAAPATAWMRYYLMGDAQAAAWFQGSGCGLCTSKQWNMQVKNL
jgi:hypothetical protein